MTWPTTFGGLLGGDEPLSLFDGMFNQTAAMIQIPCSASGNNAVSLTPLVNCPALTAYNELGGYRFRANGNSNSAVTAQFNGLGFLPVYHADGVTQANIGDLSSGQEYVLIYSATLAGGMPGFFLEQPAAGGSGATGLGGTPGGRLTPTSGTPVVSATASGQPILYYAPYVNQFVPIWNGSTLQQYNFCSSLSDTVGLSLNMASSVNWPINNAFDVYVTLNSGVPILATVQWTHPGPSPAPLRATALSIFGGMLTNATIATMRIDAATTISVPANQGTFLGSFYTGGNGLTGMTFGTAASGGGAASFNVCNYYNKVLFTTIVLDNGAPYTYATIATRQARGGTGNQISYIQSDSERSAIFTASTSQTYLNGVNFTLVVTGISTPIGANTFANFSVAQNPTNTAVSSSLTTTYSASATGFCVIARLEDGDGNANTFDRASTDSIFGNIWL